MFHHSLRIFWPSFRKSSQPDSPSPAEKLGRAEEEFSKLVADVKDYAVFLLDENGNVRTWNSGAESILGYRAAEIVGQHFSRFYPQETIDRRWPQHELTVASATVRFEDEGWRVRRDGSQFWSNVVITALKDEAGQCRGFLKITRDLTERRKAEENARRLVEEQTAHKAAQELARHVEREREQLEVTLASIGDAVIVTDTHGRVTYLNPVAEQLTGWSLARANGAPLSDVFRIVNEDSGETVENPVDRVFREGRVVGLANHTVLIADDGRAIPIEDSAAPIREPGGAIRGAMLVFRDVSESRKAMETRLRLAAIVDSSDDAIIGQDLEGKIMTWNKGAERLYQYTAEEVIGKPLDLLVPSDHPEEVPSLMQKIKAGERIEHFETVRIRKDGTPVDVSLTISPIRDSEGRVVGSSKIARDITARKQEERRKDEFLAVLAHELRNPLAPIRNGLEIMRRAEGNLAVIEDARGMMERQFHHLVRLVDDLLDVSRITRGKLAIRKEPLEVSSLIESALESCHSMIEQHGVQIETDLGADPIVIEADRTRMTQVLYNLIANAIKYGGREPKISISSRIDNGSAVITVRDNGIGIPAHMIDRVFDMFTQVDASLEKAQGGLGVGLHIVRRLVDMHGGTIGAKSDGPGRGSEFELRLPLAPAQGHEASISGGAKFPVGASRRILVVDDNVDAATSLAMMLELEGNEVRVAHDGEDGVRAAKEFRPEVVLLDIGMPKLNGLEACRQIRGEPWGKGATLIALTGWGQEADRLKSSEAGFDAHLVKPIDLEALASLLSNLGAKPSE